MIGGVNVPVEVHLHLLRHAHAGDPMKWHGSDAVRPLSEKGRRQAERLGRLLAGAGFAPDAIVTSPLTRAMETAQLVAEALGLQVRADDALAGPLDIADLERLLRIWGDPASLLIVGHDPDFSQLAADLTGLAELPVRKGTLVRIDLRRPLEPASGLLRWFVPPDVLGGAD